MTMADRRAIVIGAGAVGLSAATHLLRHGFAVTVLEEGQPGSGASHGNSGMLVADTALPTAMPGMIWKVPRWLADPLGPLALRPAYLPRATPWLLRYLHSGRRSHILPASAALRELHRRTFDGWEALLGPAAFAAMVRRKGQVYLWENLPDAPPRGIEDELRERAGVPAEPLDAAALRRLYPGIAPSATHGLLVPGNGHSVDPGGMVRALADRFLAEGGILLREKVLKAWPEADGGWRVMTNLANHAAPALVVAAGAWSARLLRPLGIRIPLESERGYHAMLPGASVDLAMPLLNKSAYFGMCGMAGGLRVSGTVEIAGLDAAPTLRRAEQLVLQAQRLFPDLASSQPVYWMGHRPSTPDSLPVIGPAAGRPGLHLCFGHGHAGLTGAPASGLLLAQMMARVAPAFDPAPYLPRRFGA
jgi:D-amino-acid dehydrogenase